jgi:hypothetical protein
MKKIIISLLVINGLLFAVLLGLLYIAETSPIPPNSSLHPLQLTAEQLRARLTTGQEPRAQLALDLAERRLADLATVQDPDNVSGLIEIYQRSLAEAYQRLEVLPVETQTTWQQRFSNHLVQAEIVARSFEDAYEQRLLSDLDKYQPALQNGSAAEHTHSGEIAAVPVPFLGQTVEHEIFVLEEAHRDLDCAACHVNGVYANTPAMCSNCHNFQEESEQVSNLLPGQYFPDSINFANPYPEHFAGECDQCHTATDWVPYQFDHVGVVECQSCHLDDLPLEEHAQATRDFLASYFPGYRALDYPIPTDGDQHYPGDCNLCHSSYTDWTVIEYTHTGIQDCESCHVQETPEQHYEGACMRCHTDTEDWNVYLFDHTGLTNCQSCHRSEAPAQHYRGVCSACHTTTSWLPAFFNHQGYSDCRSCHTNANHYSSQCSSCHNATDWFETTFNHDQYDKCNKCHTAPDQHYPGQCSTCHSNKTWDKVSFSHATFPDCQSCHQSSQPAPHYPGACSNCHNTLNWEQALFNHSGLNDCQDCHTTPAEHYPGNCATCHNALNWAQVSFNHTGFYNCETCHAAPAEHYPVPCSECHNSFAWFDVRFNHTGYNDCLSCHATPAEHYPGACLECHVTDSWYKVTFDHTTSLSCTSCHTEVSGHWPGECGNCHETTSWEEVHFDHTGYTNCKACHTHPANHSRGQCSRCHVTDGWGILLPTPTPTATQVPPTNDQETQSGELLPGWPLPTPTPTTIYLPSLPLPTPAPILP